MSWVFAAIYDRFMQANETLFLTAWREELLGGLEGAVLEVGAGTGANLPYYSKAITQLVIAEPETNMRKHLREKQKTVGAVQSIVSDASLENLPMADDSFDAVVCTLVLCSVPDQKTALGEIFRVLKPGGRFLFLEHVRADDSKRFRRHRWIEPLWKWLAGNCHLTRPTEDIIRSTGFDIDEIKRENMPNGKPLVLNTIRGVARKPVAQFVAL